MSFPEVTVRCAKCRRPLATFYSDSGAQRFPDMDSAAWSDPSAVAWITACPKHGGVPTPMTLDELNAAREARGLPDADPSRLMMPIAWRTLRRAYLDSRHAQRPVDVSVSAQGRSM